MTKKEPDEPVETVVCGVVLRMTREQRDRMLTLSAWCGEEMARALLAQIEAEYNVRQWDDDPTRRAAFRNFHARRVAQGGDIPPTRNLLAVS